MELKENKKLEKFMFHETDNGILLCGDCLEIMPLLEKESVDLVLTDPPYGIGANKMTLGSGKKEFVRGGDWDKEKPDISWIPNFAKWYCVWGGNYFADILPLTNHILIWHKRNDNLSFSECELAWTNSGKQTRIKSHHWGGEEKQHPTQKPLKIMQWCLTFFPDADLILDPFLGSGTTALACERLDRKWIGIEMSEDYCNIAVKRLKEELSQGKLF